MLFFRLKKIILFSFLKENSFQVTDDLVKKIFEFINDKIIEQIVFNSEIQKKIKFSLHSIKKSYRKFSNRNKETFYKNIEQSDIVLHLDISQASNFNSSKIIKKLISVIEHATLKIKELEKVCFLILL